MEINRELGVSWTEERTKEVLSNALVCLEILLGQSIRPIRVEEKRDLGTQTYDLMTFPVRDFQVEKSSESFWFLDSRLGLLYCELPKASYLVKYEVGYRDGEYPAYILAALMSLLKWRQTGSEEDRETFALDVGIGKRIVAQVLGVKDGLKAT